jgi:D-serine/D-alanine/glycine transporter
MMQAFQIVGAVSALLFVFVWSLILVSYLVYCRRRPEAHDTSVFRMPLASFMPYVVLLFFVVVIYAVSLDGTTRTALYVLPLWFLMLGILFLVKTYHNADYAMTQKIFVNKVMQEKTDAKTYRLKVI